MMEELEPGKRVKQLERQVEELLARKQAERADKYACFGRRYFDDPVGFARECIHWPKGEGLTAYQEEILGAIPEKKRIATVSCHGAGKTTTCSVASLWFCLTREALKCDWKAILTASVSTQLTRFLWPEVRLWARSLNWNRIGREPFSMRTELLSSALQLKYGQAFCVSPEEPAKLEGAHAKHLFYAIDEAKIVKDPIWDSVEGAFLGAGPDTDNHAFCLAFSTPGGPVGRFYDIHARKKGFENWWPRKIKIEEVVAAKRISENEIEQKKLQWGQDSSIFKQKILAEFASDDESSLIPHEWIIRAIERGEGMSRA